MRLTMPRLLMVALCTGVCAALDPEDFTGDCVGEACSWQDGSMDGLFEEEEPGLSLLQVGAAAIQKNSDLDGKYDSKDSDSGKPTVVQALSAHNHTVGPQQDQNQSSKPTNVANRVDVGSVDRKPSKRSSVAQYLEVSSNGIALDPMQQMTDTSSFDVAARLPKSIQVTAVGLESRSSSKSLQPELANSTQQLHNGVPGEASRSEKHTVLGSRALEVLAPMRVRMDQLGVFHLLAFVTFAATALHLRFRSQWSQSSPKKAFLSSQSSDTEEFVEEAAPKAPAIKSATIGADGVAPVLDAIGKLVLPSRETWYVESLDDILKERGTFKIFCMSDGMSLQTSISSESSHNGPRRSLEILEGKSLLYRVCSSVRLLHESGKQDEKSTLRISILDAKYKNVGQMRFVTPTHFEFLRNAEVIATLDVDDAGQLEIFTASGNSMACVSYGSGGCSISVNAWTDTGLILSLVLSSIILAGGAGNFLKQ